jgi:RimJ/RimL family protein N-acetyltransferase
MLAAMLNIAPSIAGGLHGKEVSLVPLGPEHAEALALASLESRQAYGFSPVPNGLEEVKQYIAKARDARELGERFAFATLWQGRAVGSTSYSDYQPWTWPAGSALQRTDRPDVVEIGYTWLAGSAQRTRCNSEAKLLMLQHAFEVWQVHRVCLRTDVRNERSRNAILRLGAQPEGVRRADKPSSDGLVRDSAFFSIVIAEWPAVRARLIEQLAR